MSLLDLLLPWRSKKKPPTSAGDRASDAAGAAALAAVIGPGAVEVGPRYVRVGDGYAATLVVTGYPAEVGPAWLEPLLAWPGRLDVTMHIEPMPTAKAASATRPPTPPQTTPQTWPTGWPAARPGCSGSACT